TQNAVDIECHLAKLVDPIDPVGHEAASRDDKTVPINRGQAILGREPNDEIAMGGGRAVADYNKATFRPSSRTYINGPPHVSGVILNGNQYRFDCKRGAR